MFQWLGREPHEAERMLDLVKASSRPEVCPPTRVWYDAAVFAKESKCVDRRDKVYGIQSLFDARLRIEVDYSMDASDVLRAFMRKWYFMLRDPVYDRRGERDFWHGCQDFVMAMDLENEIFGDDNDAGHFIKLQEDPYPSSRQMRIIRLLQGNDNFEVNAEIY